VYKRQVLGANAFPISAPVEGVYKDGIFAPDWREVARWEATVNIARAVAGLIEEGARAVLTTLTGTYWPWPDSDSERAEADCARNILLCAEKLERLSAETGRELFLALEPEPFTTAESLPETLNYFRERLFAGGKEEVARRRLGVNLDLCHAAVMFEDAAENMRAYKREGIPLFGLHLSAALRVPEPAGKLKKLRAFNEPVYLHQVSAVDAEGRVVFWSPELAELLALSAGELAEFREARVHFHVPVFAEEVGGLQTTADLTWQAVRTARDEKLTDLFVVETYTWPQLEGRKGAAPSVAEGIARELTRARAVLAGE